MFFLEESCVLLDAAFSAIFHLQCNQRCYQEEGCSLCLQTVGRMEVRIQHVPMGSTCCPFESWERDSHLHEVWCTPTSDLGVTGYGSRITGCHTCCAGPTEKGGALELELRSCVILIESRWLSIFERGYIEPLRLISRLPVIAPASFQFAFHFLAFHVVPFLLAPVLG